jgi:hypothetical protein
LRPHSAIIARQQTQNQHSSKTPSLDITPVIE